MRSTRLCRVQAPDGAQVPSLESPILRWSKTAFPVSVSLRVYRVGNGKREMEKVTRRLLLVFRIPKSPDLFRQFIRDFDCLMISEPAKHRGGSSFA
jgi:hypothetical protein